MNSKGGLFVAGLALVGGSYMPGFGAEAAHAAMPEVNTEHISRMDMPAHLDPNNPCVDIADKGASPYSIIHQPGVSISQKTFAKANGVQDIGSMVIYEGDKTDVCPDGIDNRVADAATSTTTTAPSESTTSTTIAPPETSSTTANIEADCPTRVTNMGEVSAACITLAQSTLKGYGFVDNGNSRDVKAFQILSGATVKNGEGYGKLGPKTYSEIMSGEGIAKITTDAIALLYEGVIVDKTDQTLIQLDNGVVVSGDLISTGLSTDKENRETRLGSFTVNRKKDGWVRSSLQALYADPAMYSPRYFSNGQAIHGTPAAQLWKLGLKASHGCVRTYEKFQDWLISHGLKNGSKVIIKE